MQLTPALMDKVLTYPSDLVNKIRVGRHPDNTVRVVLDLADVPRYSVFTLYNPFRLVIDAERTRCAPDNRAATARYRRRAAAGRAARRRVARCCPPSAEAAPMIRRSRASRPRCWLRPLRLLRRARRRRAPAIPPPAGPAANGVGGFSMARQLGLGVSRIVIDPGHGGHDPGVLGKGLSEAALVLDIALRLEKLLLKEPGVEVVLTRRTDVYIPLEERTAIANRQSADLFLSIHANSSRNDDAKGIETYFLSFASSPEAEAVAARENSASAREMHQLPDIIKAIALNNKLDESRDLANMVQEALVTQPAEGQQGSPQPRREEGAVRGADRRGHAERARRDFLRHEQAGIAAAEDGRLQAENRRIVADGRAALPPLAQRHRGDRDAGTLDTRLRSLRLICV